MPHITHYRGYNMQRERFTDARTIYAYDADNGKHKRLIDGLPDQLTTVNAYLSWLRKNGANYEVRMHEGGYYLVKSDIEQKLTYKN